MAGRYEGRGSEKGSQQHSDNIKANIEELLQNPEVKDRVIANLACLEPEKARELAKILLWSDSAFSFGMLGQLPRSLNFLISFLDELGLQLQNIPPHLFREFICQMTSAVDYESMHKLPRTYAPLITALIFDDHKRSASAFPDQEHKIQLLRTKIKAADFGKIRCTVNRHLEGYYPLVESAVNTVINDPVIFANLLNILPTFLNLLLKGTAKALKSIDYPPEILASAIFNLVDDLEAEELGSIINNLNLLINNLHEGSALLGQPEPRFKAVLQTITDKMLSTIDEREAAAALVALGEDFEVFCQVAAETSAQRPELAAELVAGIFSSSRAVLRGITAFIEQQEHLSDLFHEELTRELKQYDMAELAGLINAGARFGNILLTKNPELVGNILIAFSDALDSKEIASLFRTILQQSNLFSGAKILQLIPPEEVGGYVNKNLKALNQQLAEEPDQVFALVAPYLEHLDREELSKILLLFSSRTAETLAVNRQLSRSLLKSSFRIIWGLIRGSLRFSKKVV